MAQMEKLTMTNSKSKPQATDREFHIDFLRIGPYFTAASFILTFISLVIIFTKGFVFGIDFAGGTEIQVQFTQTVDAGSVRKSLVDAGVEDADVQSIGDKNEYNIRLDSVAGKNDDETNKALNERVQKVTNGLKTTFAENVTVRKVDTVGPQVGDEMKRNATLAIFYSLLAMLVYVGLRFNFYFAQGAVNCLFHDAILTLGIYSLFGIEVTVQTLAAVLTIVGYSINDTIVTFDRIRENLDIYRDKHFDWIVNLSVNETLRRTILTTLATFISIAAMYIFATGSIKEFSETMMIGVIIGAYSTIYVASPLVIYAYRIRDRMKEAKA